jgi:hypothetical protein
MYANSSRPRRNPHSERAAPPNTCPFPRFRPLEVFRRRPLSVCECCDGRRLKTFTRTDIRIHSKLRSLAVSRCAVWRLKPMDHYTRARWPEPSPRRQSARSVRWFARFGTLMRMAVRPCRAVPTHPADAPMAAGFSGCFRRSLATRLRCRDHARWWWSSPTCT